MTQTGFFWHGILSLNDFGEHAFFDIKVRKKSQKNPPIVSIYSSDIPPIPVRSEDTLNVKILLENNVGLSTVRYKVAEAQFSGEALESKTTNIPITQNFISINNQGNEWHFMRQNNCWVIYFISLQVLYSKIKKFLPDIRD
ncbi:hypothetical protein M0813_24205 [Anaeramoeba flamelloides]|uniref:Uncharacterized protein n=1 Tax=Anaeramoeba flamelloides TaxID=1746091 RepID=A0AAV7Z2A7_9EUKA|nr:hypothetical protein M0812_20274 [Anaeramoeba flamelloides]KAJ6240492.1 hypothetical protein M0813_24205 [Anaeramoeba flamelloides]